MKQFVIYLLLIFIALNLVILNLKVFFPNNLFLLSNSMSAPSSSTTAPESPFEKQPPSFVNQSCPVSCLSAIFEATASSDIRTGAPSQETNQTASSSNPREYYIPLGSGSTGSPDWTDITATETLIDPSLYGNITEAYFTVSLRNPTRNGRIEAQLYNATDKHLVWTSHLAMDGPESQTITSGKIILSNGAKIYRVQLKSTLSYPAYLDNAKIRIVTR